MGSGVQMLMFMVIRESCEKYGKSIFLDVSFM